ncbi:hypothetical protein [Hymenobacter psychrophilus]|uniref:Phospholipase/carboxylesterase n=1 Tax=Hymenobacter psychrophilus TaxID=651662 RepID=A0A1H3I2Y4_9BACT|nr:hypothetical protein [Hymenobacter psychrophilus]SDY22103.1 hypothetical protein SAMN04488069_106267 [Hymenobacter psychrophilus]
MEPKTISTARTARYISLGEPGADIQHVFFCLHGESQALADFAAQLVNFDTPERLLVLPEALSRYTMPAGPAGAPLTVASWFAADSLLPDLADLTAYLDELAAEVLAHCPAGVPVTVLGYGSGAAAACRWLAGGRTHYDRLLLYAPVFPPSIDRRATLVGLPDRPITLISTTTEAFTTEAVGAGLLQDLQDVGLSAQHRYVSEGPLTLAALGTVGK